MTTMRHFAVLLALAAGLSIGAPPSKADEYPSRSVRIIVPFGAGGPTDVYTRAIAEELRKSLHQTFVMENKPGALMRVTGLLSSRGYNIESLTVARTLDPELSRMSIVVDVEPGQRTQVIKQMNKLINVLQASDLTEGAAVRADGTLVYAGGQTELPV
jgi:tripartite-type tricarboxylate transporter receptor subunit TctC